MKPGDRVRLTRAVWERLSYTMAHHRQAGIVRGVARDGRIKIQWDGLRNVEAWRRGDLERVSDTGAP